jgi:hypothetical protein
MLINTSVDFFFNFGYRQFNSSSKILQKKLQEHPEQDSITYTYKDNMDIETDGAS